MRRFVLLGVEKSKNLKHQFRIRKSSNIHGTLHVRKSMQAILRGLELELETMIFDFGFF